MCCYSAGQFQYLLNLRISEASQRYLVLDNRGRPWKPTARLEVAPAQGQAGIRARRLQPPPRSRVGGTLDVDWLSLLSVCHSA